MYKRTEDSQLDLFNHIGSRLSARKQNLLDDPSGWHNRFYSDVVSRINEDKFSVLYDDRMGRPNASIRELIGMIILKEGNGWSDAQLFDECRFNLKVMMALGKGNIDEDVPTEATYYEFRRLVHEYNETHGVDLFKEAFRETTIGQMQQYEVQGRKIRMDSKLLNSNIAKANRLSLILEGIGKLVEKMDISGMESLLDQQVYETLILLKEKSTSNVLYGMTGEQKKELLHLLGPGLREIIQYCEVHNMSNERIDVIKRIFEDQYIIKEGNESAAKPTQTTSGQDTEDDSDSEDKPDIPDNTKSSSSALIQPKDKKEISSSSVQSVHDPEAAFRSKGKGENLQTVRGYHANITETCDEDLNLIIDGELKGANENEASFLLDSVSNCESMVEQAHHPSHDEGSPIEEVITDGGYDSVENRSEMSQPGMPVWMLAKMKGRALSFDMKYDEVQNKLFVWERSTGEECQVSLSEKGDKIVITTPLGNKRYFTKDQINDYLIKIALENNWNDESYNLRANVESTINQMYHHLGKSKKVKYRGYQACNTYMIARMFWVNHRRITKRWNEIIEKALENMQEQIEIIKKALGFYTTALISFLRCSVILCLK